MKDAGLHKTEPDLTEESKGESMEDAQKKAKENAPDTKQEESEKERTSKDDSEAQPRDTADNDKSKDEARGSKISQDGSAQPEQEYSDPKSQGDDTSKDAKPQDNKP